VSADAKKTASSAILMHPLWGLATANESVVLKLTAINIIGSFFGGLRGAFKSAAPDTMKTPECASEGEAVRGCSTKEKLSPARREDTDGRQQQA